MGRYFGLMNSTKNERVSSYWKGDYFCDLYSVMHRYGWNNTDEIVSASYPNAYIWDGENFREAIQEDYEEFIEEPLGEEKEIPKEEIKLGFPQIGEKEWKNHAPDWDEKMICKCCGFRFNNEEKEKDKQNFDATFHMN